MEKYNLDDKGGLFKFVEKRASKVVKQGDGIEMRHYGTFNPIKGTASEVTEGTIRIQTGEKAPESGVNPGDHVALFYSPSGEIFVVTGEIGSVNKSEPLDVTVKVAKIEKYKDLAKEKKYCVSLPASIKIIGIPDAKAAVIKNISFGGVKMNSREEVMMEDVIDVTITVDKINKMPFKGRVVRKTKIGDLTEYGIEYSEMTESGNKALTRLMYDLESKA